MYAAIPHLRKKHKHRQHLARQRKFERERRLAAKTLSVVELMKWM